MPFRGCLLFTWVNRSVHGSGKWYAKFRTGKFPSRNRVYHLDELVLFTGKWPRSPETGVKDGFEEMEHEFLFGIFRPEKQDNLFRCTFRCSRKFSSGTTKKVMFHLLSNRIFRNLFVNNKNFRFF